MPFLAGYGQFFAKENKSMHARTCFVTRNVGLFSSLYEINVISLSLSIYIMFRVSSLRKGMMFDSMVC